MERLTVSFFTSARRSRFAPPRSLPIPRRFSGMRWRQVGPEPRGPDTVVGRGPRRPGGVLRRHAGRRALKTTSGGTTWTAVSDEICGSPAGQGAVEVEDLCLPL